MLAVTKEEKRESIVEEFKTIDWTQVVLCVIGFLVSRIGIFDGFYTVGVCYMAAVFHSREIRKWGAVMAALGLISVDLFSGSTVKYLFVILLVVLIRGYIKVTGGKYNIKNQTAAAGCALFSINLIWAAINHFQLFEVFAGMLEVAAGVSLVIIFSFGLEVIMKNRKTPLTQKETISMGFLSACILGGLIDFYIQVPLFQSIYFKDVAIFVLIIAISYLGGANSGVTMSLVVSTLLVLIGYMPSHFAVIYTLAVLIGTIFLVLGRMGVILATGIGLLLGFALFNNRVVDMHIMGAYVAASIISVCFPKSYFGMADWFGYEAVREDERHLIRVQRIITERLSQFSKAFYNLSHTFERISDKKVVLDEKDVNYIIEDTGEKICQGCSMKAFCWKDYLEETYQGAYKMLDLIEKKGQLTLGDIPESFGKTCINAESFACTLSFKLDLFKQNLMWKNRFAESRSLVGEQFRAIAESIGNLSQSIEKQFYFNKEDEELIREMLHSRGIRTKEIMVLEKNSRKEEIHIYIDFSKRNTDVEEELIKVIYDTLGIKTEVEKHECSEEERYLYFKFKLSKAYGVMAGAAFYAKEEVSGDVYSFMEVEEGKYLLALADGMGSGKLASEESTATIELLENFMDSGFKNDLAVKIINSALVLRSSDENFSTMDITLIDEYTGAAEFVKMGAATSFILRNGEVTTVKSSTLPVGLLSDIDMEVCKKQLKDGDIIIMVTDGMLQAENDLLGKEDTFKHFILEADTNNPKYMAEYLIKKSRDLLGNAENDDMTIIVARIWQTKKDML